MHLALQHPVGETLMRGKVTERYIVIGLKGLLKKIRNNCIQCQRMHAQPMRQQMAPLPSWRFEKPYRVFSKVGINFAGPFEVITAPAGLKQNRYVLLFTCLREIDTFGSRTPKTTRTQSKHTNTCPCRTQADLKRLHPQVKCTT